MKNHTDTLAKSRKYAPRGFTLIELLVVISIIGILAALLLPVLSRVKIKAQVQKARMEEGGIATAIHSYESDTSKFPASTTALNAATAVPASAGGPEDFTFGTYGVTCVGPGGPVPGINSGFKTPATAASTCPISAPGTYQTNNSEVMAVLLDVEYWPNSPTLATINQGHVKNPQKTPYLNATMSGNITSPGIGTDGVYRDPWGNPYIITMDLNFDEKARDGFYRNATVSADVADGNSPKRGLNGLIPKMINGNPIYEANSPVMVWSAGPDKLIDPNTSATLGANKDNVIGWKQ
jgi:prepilin-type N-terminal cleavage/methylation domain-containing protein